MERFINKVSVITGSGSGIGAAIAKEFVKSGLIVVGLDLTENKLKEISDELLEEKFAGKFLWRICDVRKKDDIVSTFKSIIEDVGQIWILVNCAGVLIRSTLLEVDDEGVSNTLDTNVKGLLLCAKEVLKFMIKDTIEGHIININSINGHYIRNTPGISTRMVYAASKHAVTVLTEGLRQENMKRKGKVKFSSISPGNVVTRLSKSEGKLHPESTEALLPKNIADAVIAVLNTPPTVLISELTIMCIYQEI
ncbi:hypothetical protein PGB90_010371 [Kerria lacca]